MINLLIITSIIVFIVDLSGIIPHIKQYLHRKYIRVGDWTNLSLKPLDCSLCLTFWTGLIYLLFTKFTLPLMGYVCLLAYLTPIIAEVMIYVKDALIYLLNLLYKLIGQ